MLPAHFIQRRRRGMRRHEIEQIRQEKTAFNGGAPVCPAKIARATAASAPVCSGSHPTRKPRMHLQNKISRRRIAAGADDAQACSFLRLIFRAIQVRQYCSVR